MGGGSHPHHHHRHQRSRGAAGAGPGAHGRWVCALAELSVQHRARGEKQRHACFWLQPRLVDMPVWVAERLFCTVGVHPTRCGELDEHPGGPDAYMAELMRIMEDGQSDGKACRSTRL